MPTLIAVAALSPAPEIAGEDTGATASRVTAMCNPQIQEGSRWPGLSTLPPSAADAHRPVPWIEGRGIEGRALKPAKPSNVNWWRPTSSLLPGPFCRPLFRGSCPAGASWSHLG